MPRRNLNILIIGAIFGIVCCWRANTLRYAPTISYAMGIIDDLYIESVDRRDLFEGAMKGLFENNLDENSAYIPPSRYTRLMENLEQVFGGVGIEVGEDKSSSRLMVLSPLVNTPAARAGLQPGDLLLSIDGHDTTDMKLTESVGLMRGKAGSDVDIQIRPYGTNDKREVTIQRAVIPIQSVLGDTRNLDGTWNYVLEADPTIGYVRVVNFGDNTKDELATSLKPILQDIGGLIIDLRGNPGGLLPAAYGTCDLFVDSGTVVSIKRRSGDVETTYSASKENTVIPQDLPIVVLIDAYSASASEIVAACLQDHGRAAVAGQRSYGKGTVQNVLTLEGGRSAMKLTTATYWRPNGKNIHRLSKATEKDDWGVRPDEGLEIVFDDREILQVMRQRRIRDVVPRVREAIDLRVDVPTPDKIDLPSDTEADSESDADSPRTDESIGENPKESSSGANADDRDSSPELDSTAIEAVEDRQLLKAIDHIQHQMQAIESKQAA